MDRPIRTLKNPPIIEAILDLDCDMQPGLNLNALESDFRDAYHERYPQFQPVFITEQHLQIVPSSTETTVAGRKWLRGYQFSCSEGDQLKQMVQLKGDGYSFNRLPPYTSLDNYLPEIRRTWELFRKIASPVQVRTIRLRYINRMLLPFPAEGSSLDLEHFLALGPRLPDEQNLQLAGFLNQYYAFEPATENHVTTALLGQPREGNYAPIILDIAAFKMTPLEPENWAGIEEIIKSLRDLKNRVFQNTITDRCIALFQQ